MYSGVGQAFGQDLLSLASIPGALIKISTNRGFAVQVVDPLSRPPAMKAIDSLHVVEEEFLPTKPPGVRTYVSTPIIGSQQETGWASWGVKNGFTILVATQPLPATPALPLLPRLALISVLKNTDAVANFAAEGSSFAILSAPKAVWDEVIKKPGVVPPPPGQPPPPAPGKVTPPSSNTLTYAAVGGVAVVLFLLATR